MPWAQWIGEQVGHLIARLPGRYGERLSANYLSAFPDATLADVAAAGRNTGRMMLEMPYFWMRPARVLDLTIEPPDYFKSVTPLLAEGR
ncbi:MAG: lysophospholipid acyltransferase family protein, partial [Burkholderiaceae bacterium]